MRMVFGVLSLLIAVAVVGLLAKKQLAALSGAGTAPAAAAGVVLPAAAPQAAGQQLPAQFKQSLDEALQAPRPPVDDK